MLATEFTVPQMASTMRAAAHAFRIVVMSSTMTSLAITVITY